MKNAAWKSIILSTALLLLVACDAAVEPISPTSSVAPATVAVSNDDQLQSQVENAIARASDLPQDFTVAVQQGVVTISGSLACEDCGGLRTPGNIGTVQQSLGAVVRAVPGVDSVQFSLDYAN